MRLNGKGLVCDDGVVRPVLQGFIQLADGKWKELLLLMDSGADRTVLTADFLALLSPLEKRTDDAIHLAGVGGLAGSITVETSISFLRGDGRRVSVRGLFSVFTAMNSSDLSILGRDVSNNFAVVYDYPGKIVALLSGSHSYEIKNA